MKEKDMMQVNIIIVKFYMCGTQGKKQDRI